ncbi:MAG: T9SS C-terminal target domain-containing protein [Ignavibacteriales bacterium]|nr:MAG: T9SS C-terminal target domain-containing protein [Ignavibacteriales bacterium]
MKILKLFFFILVALTLFSKGLIAQDIKNMSLLGNYGRGEGESKGVFAAGSVVYYGLGNKIQIASFSNPAAPVKIGSVILSDVVEALVRTAINGNQYLVASGGNKMWLVNVQNPTAPSLVSTVEVTSGTTCEGIATSGTYAYVAAGSAGFKVYNIATPVSPTFVASIDSLAYCESVVISGQYAYVAAGTRSHIVDITTPATPVYVGRIAAYGGYHQYMNVRSGYAYVCNYDAGLAVVNVTNPVNPVNVMAIPSGHRTAGIIFDGNYAYVAVGDTGMVIYNVSNPASPVFTSKIRTTGRAAFVSYGAVSINGVPTGHIFVSNRLPAPGISAINVANPATPVTSSFLEAFAAPTGIAYSPFYSNGKVYVAYGTAGLRILDVSTPSSPTLLSTLALSGEARGVAVKGNYAYVVGRDAGVHVVDVSNAASPVLLKTMQTSRSRGIAINGNYAYVATRDSGLVVWNVADPANPIRVAAVKGIDVENVAVAGNVVGTSFYSSIRFYDVTSPENPIAKGSTPTFTIGNEGFSIAGNYAYIPDGDSLKIFNINNLNTPTLVSKIKTGGYGYVATVAGNYCYVASEGTGVRTINISNPAVPVEVGYYDGVPQSRGLTVYGKYIYVVEKTDGLTIYSNDLVTSVANEYTMIPNTITLHQNFPNPFNPTTNITIELKERTIVSLEVFNLIGQRVAILLNNQLLSGSFNVPFDGTSLSTGVYLYRLQANGMTVAKKMILIK